ncbi:hypothetical protein [Adhaeribacter aquaticus]|uniref:hypothetical protein n=1 Tax=Adhaeribacter aquaticus TaxID=299567 RepID=UPI0003FABF45|nr:hypothetical protein [Adhaeribacter aquaticus]
MELKDLFLTPIYLIILYGVAYWLRPKCTDKVTKKYFIPALTVKFIGAIALGVIYQFYYGKGTPTGDTFNYFNHIKVVFSAFLDSPVIGVKLLLSSGEFDSVTAKYASKMEWYRSSTEFFVIKIGSFFSLISFNTYTVIALFFALLSFSGIWAMFMTFYKLYPTIHKNLAYANFFLPSVFFWGSGLMKDSITIGALGWLFFGFYQGLIQKKNIISSLIIIAISFYIIYSVKVYVILSFLPPALFWVFNENSAKIKNSFLRAVAKPIFLTVGGAVATIGALNLTEGDERYDVDKIGERTKINSEYLSGYEKNNSAYNIGEFDGSISSMLKVAPQAINVAIFRPYLWEVRNPVMLLSAIESFIFIFLTLKLFMKAGFFQTIKRIIALPIVNFSILFTIILAFAVGTNSGNFGTLVRYKIPFMPFYLSALYIMQTSYKKAKPPVKVLRRKYSHT